METAAAPIKTYKFRHPDGFINIERLMTRLDQLMPCDLSQGHDRETRVPCERSRHSKGLRAVPVAGGRRATLRFEGGAAVETGYVDYREG